MDPDRITGETTGESVVVEFQGISQAGEIVFINSDDFDVTLCGRAGDAVYQAGDYAHPAGSNAPLTHMKYYYVVQVTTTTDNWAASGLQGPVGNITILPPITLSNAQIRQRDRELWPLPSPLEEGAYGLCYKPFGTGAWRPQLGNRARFAVGPVATRRIVSISPAVIFPFIDAEILLEFGPDPSHASNPPIPRGMSVFRDGATDVSSDYEGDMTDSVLASAGDLLAIRDTATIDAINCSFVRRDEVQRISPNRTIRTGALTVGANKYHFCVAKADVLEWVPPGGVGTPWPYNFSQQYLVRLSVANVLNIGGGHQVGVFTDQALSLRGTTSVAEGIDPATRSRHRNGCMRDAVGRDESREESALSEGCVRRREGRLGDRREGCEGCEGPALCAPGAPHSASLQLNCSCPLKTAFTLRSIAETTAVYRSMYLFIGP